MPDYFSAPSSIQTFLFRLQASTFTVITIVRKRAHHFRNLGMSRQLFANVQHEARGSPLPSSFIRKNFRQRWWCGTKRLLVTCFSVCDLGCDGFFLWLESFSVRTRSQNDISPSSCNVPQSSGRKVIDAASTTRRNSLELESMLRYPVRSGRRKNILVSQSLLTKEKAPMRKESRSLNPRNTFNARRKK